MVLSAKTIEERYGKLSPYDRVKKMVQDSCDEALIMAAVRDFGYARFQAGRFDSTSRAANKPGDGDMGG